MNRRLAPTLVGYLLLLGLVAAAGSSKGLAAELKLEAQLIWGANAEKSPDPSHKAVSGEVAKKLKSLPFKWKNYFEVNRQQIAVSVLGVKKVAMSKECEIVVRNLGNTKVEVVLIGKGEQIGKITQALPKGELLVIGGNAPNFSAWFVVLKQVE